MAVLVSNLLVSDSSQVSSYIVEGSLLGVLDMIDFWRASLSSGCSRLEAPSQGFLVFSAFRALLTSSNDAAIRLYFSLISSNDSSLVKSGSLLLSQGENERILWSSSWRGPASSRFKFSKASFKPSGCFNPLLISVEVLPGSSASTTQLAKCSLSIPNSWNKKALAKLVKRISLGEPFFFFYLTILTWRR